MSLHFNLLIPSAMVFGGLGFLLGRFTATELELPKEFKAPPHEAEGVLPITKKMWSGPGQGPSDLRARLEGEKNSLARYKLAMDHMQEWVVRDPRGALEWIKSQQPSVRRKEVLRMALAQFADKEPKSAAEWIVANLAGQELHNNLIMVSQSWSRSDGFAAATWLSGLPATKERNAALESTLFGWGTVDPTAAADYAGKEVSDGELASVLRRASYAGWAKSDPLAAVAASLASSRVHGDMNQFANTLANWATVDLAASSEWLLKNVSNPKERTEAVLELSAIYASQSPDAGIEWIAGLPEESERQLASNQFALDWASVDPAASAKWASEQAPGLLSDEVQMEILLNYHAADTAAFEQWRNSLPEGTLRHKAADLVAPTEQERE